MADEELGFHLQIKGQQEFVSNLNRDIALVRELEKACQKLGSMNSGLTKLQKAFGGFSGAGKSPLGASADLYRMQQATNLVAKETENLTKATGKVNKAQEATTKSTGRMSAAFKGLGSNALSAAKHTVNLERSLFSLSRKAIALGGGDIAGSFAKYAVGYGTLYGGINAAQGGLSYGMRSTGQLEQAQIAYQFLTKKPGGEPLLGQLQNYATHTNYSIRDVLSGGQRMMAMGFKPEEIMPLMKVWGEVGATGITDPAEAINRITYALGQIKPAGILHAPEIRQLTEMGVPVYEMLSEQTGKSTTQLMDMVSENKITGDAAIAMMTKGIQSRFQGLQDAQSKTLFGMWNTFTETMWIRASKGFEPLREQIKGILPTLTVWADRGMARVNELIKAGGKFADDWKKNFRDLVIAGGDRGFMGVMDALDKTLGAKGLVSKGARMLKQLFHDVGVIFTQSILPAARELAPLAGYAFAGFVGLVHLAAENPDAVKYLLLGMVAGYVALQVAILGATGAQAALNLTFLANPATLVVVGLWAIIAALTVLIHTLEEGTSWWESFGKAAHFAALAVPGLSIATVAADAINKMKGGSGNAFADFFGGVGKKVNGAIGDVQRYLSPSVSMPEPQSGEDVNKLLRTGMASGGTVTSAGWSWVGENGPEVRWMPRNAEVRPLSDGQRKEPLGNVTNNYISISGADLLNNRKVADVVIKRLQSKAARV